MRKPFYWESQKAWYVKVRQPNGKLTNHRLHKNEDSAHRIWAKMVDDTERATDETRMLAIDVVSLYVEHLEGRVAAGTLAAVTARRWEDDLVSFSAQDHVQGVTVADLKRHHGSTWIESQHTWNATTRHYAAKTLRRAFRWAVDEGRITENPFNSLSYKKGAPRDFVISEELFQRMHDGVANKKRAASVVSFQTLLRAFRLSGCRPGELAALRIEHVEQNGRQMRWVMKHHKTEETGKPRIVPCCPCLRTLTLLSIAGRTSGPVFRPRYGFAWDYHMMRQRMKRLRTKLSLPSECVLYSFRHTSITNALKAGVDVATVADMHGTSIAILQKHYAHLIQDQEHMHNAATKAARFRHGG